MPAPKKYPVELRDRSVRLVEDLLADPDLELSVTGACNRVAEQLGSTGTRCGGSSAESLISGLLDNYGQFDQSSTADAIPEPGSPATS